MFFLLNQQTYLLPNEQLPPACPYSSNCPLDFLKLQRNEAGGALATSLTMAVRCMQCPCLKARVLHSWKSTRVNNYLGAESSSVLHLKWFISIHYSTTNLWESPLSSWKNSYFLFISLLGTFFFCGAEDHYNGTDNIFHLRWPHSHFFQLFSSSHALCISIKQECLKV